jgi:hypothetical protein
VRDVMEDICIGGTTFRKGNKILVSHKYELVGIRLTFASLDFLPPITSQSRIMGP